MGSGRRVRRRGHRLAVGALSETYVGSFGGAAALGAAADQALLADVVISALTAAWDVAHNAGRVGLADIASTPELAWFHAAQFARAMLGLPLWDSVEAFRAAAARKGGPACG